MFPLRRNVLWYERAALIHRGLIGVVFVLHTFTEMAPAAGVVLGMGLPQSTELSIGPRGAAVLTPR